jgi:hypothetical protein
MRLPVPGSLIISAIQPWVIKAVEGRFGGGI